jgi:hypothetical protein
MAVARMGAASLEFGDPTATFDLDNASGVFELVEVRRDPWSPSASTSVHRSSSSADRSVLMARNDDRQRAFAPQ